MEWRVDDASIAVLRGGMTHFRLVVDGVATAKIPNGQGGRFEIPWKKRTVELRRVGPNRGLESALYVDDVLVPPSTEGPGRGVKGECDAHGKMSRRRCPSCDDVVCPSCLSVDGVRCEACLEATTTGTLNKRRRNWWIGAGFCLLVSVLCFWGAAATGNDFLPKAAGTMLFGAGFMVYVGFRSYDGTNLPLWPATFELDDAPPQIAGRRCRACKERIGTAKAGQECATCRRAFHADCLEGHPCKPPVRGPDWDRMALESA